jgi:hypothetical protein
MLAWSMADDQGAKDGMSRYFEIQNLGSSATSLGQQQFVSLGEDQTGNLKLTARLKEKGFGNKEGISDRVITSRAPRRDGDNQEPLLIEIEELERIVIELMSKGGAKFVGWAGDETKELPIGSTLDSEKGLFYWHPGPGFLGKHVLHFAVSDGVGRSEPITVVVNIIPKKYIRK